MSLAKETTQKHRGVWCGSYGLVPTPGHSKRDRGTIIRDLPGGRVYTYSFNEPDYRKVHAGLGVEAAGARVSAKDLAKARAEHLAAVRDHQRKQLETAGRLWNGAAAFGQSAICGRYLRQVRRIPDSQIKFAISAGALREHSDVYAHPALLALATDDDGDFHAVQVTRLTRSGEKRHGAPRLTFGPLRGAAVRLAAAGDVLAIAEGVETALSFSALHGFPCWATLGTSNLKSFNPPRGVKRLIIAADGDAAGMEAANTVFERLKNRVRVQIAPAPQGQDWNDVIRGGSHGAR